ncbi:MAG: hydrogenase maturation nickel metallochaperone HypA [Chlorobium sp.]|nr:MAG: hydrogenase maturation nickel metallochaperone HypA [Chlorobium sp.]
MHEMSIAMSIVESVVAHAQKEGALRISGVELLVGKLAGIEAESLKFCFSAAAAGTLAAKALLVVEEPEGVGECGECGMRFQVTFYYAECPKCRSLRITIVSGEEFLIQSITIEEEGEQENV